MFVIRERLYAHPVCIDKYIGMNNIKSKNICFLDF